jgi:hypothetical protein
MNNEAYAYDSAPELFYLRARYCDPFTSSS